MQTLLDELDAALAAGSAARRSEMLDRIAALFIGAAPYYSDDQIALFDDVMSRLITAVDGPERAELARRLATIANAPPNVIHLLAFDDDIEVAGPVISQSERLDERQLLAIATTKSQHHLLAVSDRPALDEAITDVVIERGDRGVIHSLVRNATAKFSDDGFRMLVHRANGDDALAIDLGMRGDIPRPHFLVLLENASRAVRSRLAAENPQTNAAIEAVVAEVVDGIRSEIRRTSPEFRVAPALSPEESGAESGGEAEIYRYASEHRLEETAAALAGVSGMPVEFVRRALLGSGTEIILILAKVAGLSAETTKAVLQLRPADRGAAANDLHQALASFERLRSDTASRVLEFFRTRAKKPAESEVPPAAAVNA